MLAAALAPSRYLDLNLRYTKGRHMSDWPRKHLEELYDCVHSEILATLPTSVAMVDLNNVSHQLQLSKSEPARNLESCRESMCEICRENRLYKCDIDEGWSSNCAFVRHHVS